jgi:hypothetical protein
MAAALGEVGAGSSVGYCACLRRELSGEPDAGNLHLRFDEGRVGRAIVVALSPTLPPGPAEGRSPRTAPCSSSAMSFRAGYSLAGCSPAEPASASPTALSIHCGLSAGNDLSANGNLSLVSVPQHRGAVQAALSTTIGQDV